MIAGLDVESSVQSCGNDVLVVLVVELEEPVDNPGDNDWHVVFRVAFVFSAVLDVVFDHWCTHGNIRDFSKSFPSDRTAGVSLRIHTVTKKPR